MNMDCVFNACVRSNLGYLALQWLWNNVYQFLNWDISRGLIATVLALALVGQIVRGWGRQPR